METQYCHIDRDLLVMHGLTDFNNTILYDRDKISGKLNDRIIILKLSHYLCSACPQCLAGIGMEF